jgi:hypothetical protein
MRFGVAPAYHVVLTTSRALLFAVGPRTRRAVLLGDVPRSAVAIEEERRGVVADRLAVTLGKRRLTLRLRRGCRGDVAAFRRALGL